MGNENDEPAGPEKSLPEKFKDLEKAIRPLLTVFNSSAVIAVLLFISAIIFGGIQFLRSTARDAVLDEKVLERLSERIRPTIVFDSAEQTIASSGMDVLSDYTVQQMKSLDGKPGLGFVVTLRFKEDLNNPPILTCLDGALFVTQTTPHKKDWEFLVTLPDKGPMALLNEQSFQSGVFRFKVELIP